jgi:hypothetical protein
VFPEAVSEGSQEEGGLAYIACDLEDYRVAHDLMQAILPSTLTNFPKSALSLYETIRPVIRKESSGDGHLSCGSADRPEGAKRENRALARCDQTEPKKPCGV